MPVSLKLRFTAGFVWELLAVFAFFTLVGRASLGLNRSAGKS